jgi:hypothetical protein
MADNGVASAGGRPTDWVSLGVLAAFVPRDAVDDAVAAAGKQARRSDGKLPPHVMVYFTAVMADITREKHLNPRRRHRTYPRAIKRARHNSYRIKRPGDHGTRHTGPATINLVNLHLLTLAA